MNNIELIEHVLDYIDGHLSEDITFDTLATIFGYSSFHFNRIFSSITGMSITDYLKKRRLTRACLELTGSNANISDICYACGFNSIQTFNRLFKDAYGMPPSKLRKEQVSVEYMSVKSIISGYKNRIRIKGEYAMEPKILEKDGFFLVGVKKHTRDGFQVIGEAWEELKARIGEITNRVNQGVSYGYEDYSADFSADPLQFYYMASVEVDGDAPVPAGMEKKSVPKSTYAVFTLTGNNVLDEIGNAFRYIYDIWLPGSKYCMSDEVCADFEYYDEQWDCRSSLSKIDIYIPIKKLDT